MNILIIRNSANPDAFAASDALCRYLDSRGIAHAETESLPLSIESLSEERRALSVPAFDMVVSLGGDGTMLHSARLVGESKVPILGINFGHLGFLVDSPVDGVEAIVAAAIAGDVEREERASLTIELTTAEGVHLAPRFALNELAVTRGALGRVISFDVAISGTHLMELRGDGLIVSTATGSTGYALSAGGPLVAPDFRGLIVVPLVPHTLQSRTVVTDPDDVVHIDLTRNPESREASLFVDGELITPDEPIEHATIRRTPTPTVLLRYKRENFYREIAGTFFGTKDQRG